jgi:hypothetical protein
MEYEELSVTVHIRNIQVSHFGAKREKEKEIGPDASPLNGLVELHLCHVGPILRSICDKTSKSLSKLSSYR